MRKLLTFLFCLFIMLMNQAQVPNQLNYQGVARKANGNAMANEGITLRLTIHDLTADGLIVYREKRAVTTNSFGLFNVAIGGAGATAGDRSIRKMKLGTGK